MCRLAHTRTRLRLPIQPLSKVGKGLGKLEPQGAGLWHPFASWFESFVILRNVSGETQNPREPRSLFHVERQNCADRRRRMSIIGWIILGLIAGFIASKLVNRQGEGIILDIVLGIVGAIVGGWLFSFFGAAGVTGLNLYSMLVAVIGAVVVLVIYHAVADRGATV
jgi:uncharacterized membrane protein YeaQ/YmgE (transglycosylase-associated protein family)